MFLCAVACPDEGRVVQNSRPRTDTTRNVSGGGMLYHKFTAEAKLFYNLKKRHLVNSRTVFFSTIIVAAMIILLVYLTGLENHRSLYRNSLITTTILLVVFFCFIATGLYRGWKLKDTLGNFWNHFSKLRKPKRSHDLPSGGGLEGLEAVDGEAFIVVIILWVVVALFGVIFVWYIGAFFWGIILVVAGLLYWIIFRAYRLIFRHSVSCKGDLTKSVKIACIYSVLYVSWIYAIILISHYFNSVKG
jgi:hypothetical protein